MNYDDYTLSVDSCYLPKMGECEKCPFMNTTCFVGDTMKQLMERTLLDDLKDFASFLKSNACVWGSRIDNGETKSLLITDTELENAIKQYLWEKL